MKSQKSVQEYKNQYNREHYVTWKVTFLCDDCTIQEVEEWCRLNKMSKNEFIKKSIKQALKIGLED